MDTNKWIDDYLAWMKTKYSFNSFSKGDEIITPFTNIIGDNLAIYVQQLEPNKIKLSDDGNTFNDLILLGIDIKSKSRIEIINSIINTFKLKVTSNNILFIEGKPESFPIMKQSLVQAILRINDLLMTRKNNIKNLFFEDVLTYFDDNEFKGLPNYPVIGGSGNTYKISYAIGKSKIQPLQLIQVLNNADFQRISAEIITFEDIKNNIDYNSDNMNYSVIFNNIENNISDKSQNIARMHDLKIIPWSDKSKILNLKN